MKNILLIVLLSFTFVYAETTKTTDTNKTMTDDEFMKQLIKLDNDSKQIDKQLEAQKKLRKTVDEVKSQLRVK